MGNDTTDKISVPCKCGAKLKAPASAVGKKAKCPKCGELLVVEAPAPRDDFEDALYDLAGGAEAASKAEPEETPGSVCPSCYQAMSPGAVLCTACGYDMRTGKAVSMAPNAPPAPPMPGSMPPARGIPSPVKTESAAAATGGGSLVMGVILSALGAAVGALVWFGIAKATDREIGWIAWGVGLAAGAGMAMGYRQRNVAAGGIAALMSIGGILLGKYLVFIMVVIPAADKELSQMMDEMPDHEVLRGHMVAEEIRKQGVEPLDATEAQTESASVRAEELIAAMDKPTLQAKTSEAREAAKSLMTNVIAHENQWELFQESMFGVIDIVFALIAVATAFKVATVSAEGE